MDLIDMHQCFTPNLQGEVLTVCLA
jgi:hypothetical protein